MAVKTALPVAANIMGIRTYKNGTIRLTGKDANNFANALWAPYRQEDFCKKYPIGDTVIVDLGNGQESVDIIKSKAIIKDDNSVEVILEKLGSTAINKIKGRVE